MTHYINKVVYEQIYDLEDRLLQPEIRRSREEISMLLADDFVEFGVSGRTFDKLLYLSGQLRPMNPEKK